MSPEEWSDLLARLREPFPASVVRWRPGSVSRDKKRAMALAYVDMREYQARLDDVCGGDWELRFRPWTNDQIICELTIHGRTRSSTGNGDSKDVEVGTTAEAQSMKRACVAWGLGRYLYDLPASWVDYDDAGKRLLEVPQLPAKFLPSGATPARRASNTSAPEPAEGAETLSAERAQAMVLELEKLGYERSAGFELAAKVLGRPVKSFEQVSEAEALEVWNAAKRAGKKEDSSQKGEDPDAKLPKERADKLAESLKELGYKAYEQQQLATYIAKRQIKRLTDLTVAEAEEAYRHAKSAKAAEAP